jgi:hypothetical protein
MHDHHRRPNSYDASSDQPKPNFDTNGADVRRDTWQSTVGEHTSMASQQRGEPVDPYEQRVPEMLWETDQTMPDNTPKLLQEEPDGSRGRAQLGDAALWNTVEHTETTEGAELNAQHEDTGSDQTGHLPSWHSAVDQSADSDADETLPAGREGNDNPPTEPPDASNHAEHNPDDQPASAKQLHNLETKIETLLERVPSFPQVDDMRIIDKTFGTADGASVRVRVQAYAFTSTEQIPTEAEAEKQATARELAAEADQKGPKLVTSASTSVTYDDGVNTVVIVADGGNKVQVGLEEPFEVTDVPDDILNLKKGEVINTIVANTPAENRRDVVAGLAWAREVVDAVAATSPHEITDPGTVEPVFDGASTVGVPITRLKEAVREIPVGDKRIVCTDREVTGAFAEEDPSAFKVSVQRPDGVALTLQVYDDGTSVMARTHPDEYDLAPADSSDAVPNSELMIAVSSDIARRIGVYVPTVGLTEEMDGYMQAALKQHGIPIPPDTTELIDGEVGDE